MKIAFSKRSRNGVALIIVLLVIVVLTIIVTGFAFSMKTEMRLARRDSVESDFEWLGRSGVELARMLLAESVKDLVSQPDSLKSKWAGGPGNINTNTMSGDVIDPLAAISLKDNHLGIGTFSITITDNERKFNINVADQRILQQAMILIGVDAGQSPEIVDSILDWIDRDNDEHLSGAESDYYERLNPPYEAKNAWIDDIQELLLVRGVTPAIFWGTSSTNHPLPAVQMRDKYGRLSEQQEVYPMGLYDLFTTLSFGPININTAPVNTLMLIPGLDTNSAMAVIQHRAGLDGQDGTADDVPFQSPQDLVNVGLPPLVANQMGAYCGTKSRVFEVHVDCEIAGFHREYIALLDRNNQRDVKILSMYWKSPDKITGGTGSRESGPDYPAESSGW